VSADFRRHSAAHAFRPVLQRHDRTQFEVICYCGSTVEDAVKASFRQLSDRWRDVRLWLGGAILSAIGLTDWVATDDDQYVEIALPSAPDRLRTLRRELPDLINVRCGPAEYTRAVEAAYRRMWQKYCGEIHLGPASLRQEESIR
jgi:predicted O-linked N-acetylglucosamine transferase (SPINDLY family)